jgi:putative oxidoreductase
MDGQPSGERSTAPWALVPLRLMLGIGFGLHGMAKLGRGPGQFAEILGALGVPHATLSAWLTTLLEIGGGVALIVGFLVVPISVPLAVVMLTAMVRVHLPIGFSAVRLRAVTPHGAEFGPVGYEVNLLYLVGLLALVLGGPSPFSVDRWRRERRAHLPQSPPDRRASGLRVGGVDPR